MTVERPSKKPPWLACCILFAFALSCACSTEAGQKRHEERYSTLSDQTVELHPSGVTIQVPHLWVVGYKGGGRPSMYLTQQELKHAGAPAFLPVVAETVLSSKDCAFQAENLNPSFWLGVYVVDQPTNAIIKRISEKGRKAPARHTPGSTATVSSAKTEGTWQHIRVSAHWWFGDYGARQAVDFFVKPLPNEQTIVFVTSFNGTGDLQPGWEDDADVTQFRNRLLESVAVPKASQNLAPQ